METRLRTKMAKAAASETNLANADATSSIQNNSEENEKICRNSKANSGAKVKTSVSVSNGGTLKRHRQCNNININVNLTVRGSLSNNKKSSPPIVIDKNSLPPVVINIGDAVKNRDLNANPYRRIKVKDSLGRKYKVLYSYDLNGSAERNRMERESKVSFTPTQKDGAPVVKKHDAHAFESDIASYLAPSTSNGNINYENNLTDKQKFPDELKSYVLRDDLTKYDFSKILCVTLPKLSEKCIKNYTHQTRHSKYGTKKMKCSHTFADRDIFEDEDSEYEDFEDEDSKDEVRQSTTSSSEDSYSEDTNKKVLGPRLLKEVIHLNNLISAKNNLAVPDYNDGNFSSDASSVKSSGSKAAFIFPLSSSTPRHAPFGNAHISEERKNNRSSLITGVYRGECPNNSRCHSQRYLSINEYSTSTNEAYAADVFSCEEDTDYPEREERQRIEDEILSPSLLNQLIKSICNSDNSDINEEQTGGIHKVGNTGIDSSDSKSEMLHSVQYIGNDCKVLVDHKAEVFDSNSANSEMDLGSTRSNKLNHVPETTAEQCIINKIMDSPCIDLNIAEGPCEHVSDSDSSEPRLTIDLSRPLIECGLLKNNESAHSEGGPFPSKCPTVLNENVLQKDITKGLQNEKPEIDYSLNIETNMSSCSSNFDKEVRQNNTGKSHVLYSEKHNSNLSVLQSRTYGSINNLNVVSTTSEQSIEHLRLKENALQGLENAESAVITGNEAELTYNSKYNKDTNVPSSSSMQDYYKIHSKYGVNDGKQNHPQNTDNLKYGSPSRERKLSCTNEWGYLSEEADKKYFYDSSQLRKKRLKLYNCGDAQLSSDLGDILLQCVLKEMKNRKMCIPDEIGGKTAKSHKKKREKLPSKGLIKNDKRKVKSKGQKELDKPITAIETVTENMDEVKKKPEAVQKEKKSNKKPKKIEKKCDIIEKKYDARKKSAVSVKEKGRVQKIDRTKSKAKKEKGKLTRVSEKSEDMDEKDASNTEEQDFIKEEPCNRTNSVNPTVEQIEDIEKVDKVMEKQNITDVPEVHTIVKEELDEIGEKGNSDVSELPISVLNVLPMKKSKIVRKVPVEGNTEGGEKKKVKLEKKNNILMNGDNYIPLNISGPTKFSLFARNDLEKLACNDKSLNWKKDMIYGSRIKRISYKNFQFYSLKKEAKRKSKDFYSRNRTI